MNIRIIYTPVLIKCHVTGAIEPPIFFSFNDHELSGLISFSSTINVCKPPADIFPRPSSFQVHHILVSKVVSACVTHFVLQVIRPESRPVLLHGLSYIVSILRYLTYTVIISGNNASRALSMSWELSFFFAFLH